MTERIRMTAEEYRQLPESNQRMELIDGELITYGEEAMSPAPKDTHQHASIVLAVFLARFFSTRQIRTAPTDVYIDGQTVLQPDIFWVSPENDQCRLGDDGYWYGAPDFVIEIMSPGTEVRDRGVKYDLYEEHGVREYWLVSPVVRSIEVYIRQETGFVRLGVFGAGQTFESPILGGTTVNVGELLE